MARNLPFESLNNIDIEATMRGYKNAMWMKIDDAKLTKENAYYDVDKLEELLEKDKKALSTIHANVRSLGANFDKLGQMIADIEGKIDIICVSETWLSELSHIPQYEIEGCTMYKINRTSKKEVE